MSAQKDMIGANKPQPCFNWPYIKTSNNGIGLTNLMDHLTEAERSWNMSRIQASNTKPELTVRSFLHKRGLRFRLKNNIPGRPDIYLKKYNAVIFVHGCFWHRHENCRRATTPKSNTDYWLSKFKSNVDRDKRVFEKLKEQGRRVFIIWECQVRNEVLLGKILNEIRSLPTGERQYV